MIQAQVDLHAFRDHVTPLQDLEFETSPALDSLDVIEPLVNLRSLGIGECGTVESLTPIASREQLEVLSARGSTRIADGDLSPLAALPQLKEIRMRNRRDYSPRVVDLPAAVS